MSQQSSILDALSGKSSYFYILFSMLMAEGTDNILPELVYFLTPEQITLLIRTMGGKEVYIPTPDDLKDFLLATGAAYLKICKGLSWSAIQDELSLEDHWQVKRLAKKVDAWQEFTKKNGLNLESILKE